MNTIMEDWMKRCEALFQKALIQSEGHCKSQEPSITIGLSNEGDYWCEIYSYLVDYTPRAGRHHSFRAKTWKELTKKVEKAISKQEKGGRV